MDEQDDLLPSDSAQESALHWLHVVLDLDEVELAWEGVELPQRRMWLWQWLLDQGRSDDPEAVELVQRLSGERADSGEWFAFRDWLLALLRSEFGSTSSNWATSDRVRPAGPDLEVVRLAETGGQMTLVTGRHQYVPLLMRRHPAGVWVVAAVGSEQVPSPP